MIIDIVVLIVLLHAKCNRSINIHFLRLIQCATENCFSRSATLPERTVRGTHLKAVRRYFTPALLLFRSLDQALTVSKFAPFQHNSIGLLAIFWNVLSFFSECVGLL